MKTSHFQKLVVPSKELRQNDSPNDVKCEFLRLDATKEGGNRTSHFQKLVVPSSSSLFLLSSSSILS